MAIVDRFTACRLEYQAWRKTFGTSLCDHVERTEHRRRVERDNPKLRKTYKWSEYKRLYQKQHGKCGICGQDMPLIKGTIDMDHINPNLPPDDFEHERNRQVAHSRCNREKSSKSVPELAKSSGRTYVEIMDNEP